MKNVQICNQWTEWNCDLVLSMAKVGSHLCIYPGHAIVMEHVSIAITLQMRIHTLSCYTKSVVVQC